MSESELKEWYQSYCNRVEQIGLTPRSYQWWVEVFESKESQIEKESELE